MLAALLLAIGIPTALVVIYAAGRRKYGERWYLILGPSGIGGDATLSAELEDAKLTKLNLSNRENRSL